MVVVLLIIVLLVVSMVGAALFLQLEVRTGGNARRIAEARQNAIFGLHMALGELQELAGPDQRVTASADILDESDILTGLDPTLEIPTGNRRWVGVWDSAKPRTIPGATVGTHRLNSEFQAFNSSNNRKAKPLGWLVSGVARNTADTAPSTVQTPAWDATQSSDPKNGDPNFVTLAGSGTVDTDNHPGDAIVVPRVFLKQDTTGKNTGSYAWWVGDESQKAKLNLVEPENFSASFGNRRFVARNVAPTVNVIDAMSGISAEIYDRADTSPQGFLDRLRRLISRGQIPQVVGVDAEPNFRGHFHDLTTESLGLLADTTTGKLREDLSAYLFSGTSAGLSDNTFVYSSEIFPSMNWNNPPSGAWAARAIYEPIAHHLPRFGLLRSWANAVNSGEVRDSAVQGQKNPASGTVAHGIHPVLTMVQFPAAVQISDGATPTDKYFEIAFYPAFVLWNPYNKPLPGKHYLVGARILNNNPTIEFGSTPNSIMPPINFSELKARNLTSSSLNGVISNLRDNETVFLRTDTVSFEPGEIKIFSLKDPALFDMASLSSYPGVLDVDDVFSQGAAYWNDRMPLVFRSEVLTSPIPATSEQINFRSNIQPLLNLYVNSGGSWDLLSAAGIPETTLNGAVSTQAFNFSNPVNQNDWKPLRFAWGTSPINFPFYYAMMTLNSTGRTFGGSSQSFGMRRGLSMFNPRGASIKHPLRPDNDPIGPAYNLMGSSRQNNVDRQLREFSQSIDSFDTIPKTAFFSSSHHAGSTAGTSTNIGNLVPLFELPENPAQILNLGQFQHAQFLSSANAPAYQFGNSYIPPMLERERYAGVGRAIVNSHTNFPDDSRDPSNSNFQNSLVDVSFMANTALWDRFFLSGINPETSLTEDQLAGRAPLPNPRLIPLRSGGKNYNSLNTPTTRFLEGGRFLAINGPFNINSTSVESWKAILSTLQDMEVRSGSTSPSPAFPRFAGLLSQASSYTPVANVSEVGAYTGYRILSSAEIETLARRIVEEVKLRGPFLSLADFVNRRLISTSSDLSGNRGLGLRGALQSAIDRVSIDDDSINSMFFKDSAMAFDGTAKKINVNGSSGGEQNFYLDSGNDRNVLLNESSHTAAADIPGFLTQADILQKIGSFITARGDTFLIRAYGDSIQGASQTVQARAVCEVVVQRLPDPVEGNNFVEPAGTLGRKFQIVSFRWLTPEEI